MENTKNTIILDYDRIIQEKLKSIIDQKSDNNNAAVGRLNTLEKSWTGFNKDLEQGINEEFKLMNFEVQAMENAQARLKRNPCNFINEDTFTIAGKARDIVKEVGLPNIFIRVLGIVSQEDKPLLLAEDETDNFGNFAVELSDKLLEALRGNNREVSFQVYSDQKDPKSLVHTEDVRMNVKPGRIKDVFLNIRCGDDLTDRLESGIALRETIERDKELVNLRVENVNEAYTVYDRRVGLALEGLRLLKGELLDAEPPLPPRFDQVIGRDPGVEPSDVLGPKDDVRIIEPGEEAPEIEDIPDIGPTRAKKLTSVGIQTVADFIEADEGDLRKLLGPLKFREMKTKARDLLKEVKADKEAESAKSSKEAPSLMDIDGIGQVRARKLSAARIVTVEEFVAADNDSLKMTLGNLDFEVMKKKASALLKSGAG